MEKRHAWRLVAAVLAAWSIASAALGETFYATLKYRDTGAAVSALQAALNTLGYSTGGADGKFGPATEKAVRVFQKDHGLSVDGLAGNRTQTMIYQLVSGQGGAEATAAPTQAPAASEASAAQSGSAAGALFGNDYSTLRYGARGTRVSVMQQALADLGYDVGGVDGRFGLGTQEVVTAFQRANGLQADGLAGRVTLKLLEQLLAGGTTTNTTTESQNQAATATPAPTTTTDNVANGYSIPTRTLRKGYQGEDVRSVQKRLLELGYAIGSADGRYGTGTMAAVKAFQQRNNLTVDGLAGSGTCGVLFGSGAVSATGGAAATPTPAAAAATAAPQGSYTNLSGGSSGDAVTRLQQALKDLQYTVEVTGVYDDATKAAVVAFQQRNLLTADGIAGGKTQAKLFAGGCVGGDTALPTLAPGTGQISGPSKSEIKLLHWFDDIKPTLRTGQTILVYEPVSGLAWTLRLYSLGRHADSEPLTLQDTQIMEKAFDNQNTWNQKAVYVRLPSGVWTVGSTHDMPHLSGSIAGNGFDGHLCVHFLRDMAECEKNDPKYGVANQKTIRAAWKALTGQDYVEKVR